MFAWVVQLYRLAGHKSQLRLCANMYRKIFHLSSLLLSAVSGEDTQDRTDRAILTPWVKFLWESYRQCLDLLRNNSSVEKLYQDIAQQGDC